MSQSRVHLPVGNKRVEDLLLWRDPQESGIVLAGLSVIYFLLEWSPLSLITILANFGIVAVSAAFLWANIAKFINKPGPPIPVILREGVSESQAKSYAVDVVPGINKLLAFGYRLATGQEVVLSLQVAILLYIVARLGAIFSVLGWSFALVLLAFFVPKLYELKKDQIDDAVVKAHKQGKDLYKTHLDKYIQKIPRASTSTSSSSAATTPLTDNVADAQSMPKKQL